ncbi:MAG TPA: hypothetical protein VF516_20690 [Kofleriaceae bacterium]
MANVGQKFAQCVQHPREREEFFRDRMADELDAVPRANVRSS